MRLNKIRKFIIIILTLLILSLQGCFVDHVDTSSSPSLPIVYESSDSYIDSTDCIHFHYNVQSFYTEIKHKVAIEVKIAPSGAITVINKENKDDYGVAEALYVDSVEYIEYYKYGYGEYLIESNDGSGWKEWKTADDNYDLANLLPLKNTDSSFETLTKEAICKHFGLDENNAYTINIIHPIVDNMYYNTHALIDVLVFGETSRRAYFAKYVDNIWTFDQIGYFDGIFSFNQGNNRVPYAYLNSKMIYMKYNSITGSFISEEFTGAYQKIFSNLAVYYSSNNKKMLKDDGTVHSISYAWNTEIVYYEVYDTTSATPEVPIRKEKLL